MAKPTDLPEWATDTTYIGGPAPGDPTIVEPPSGKQEQGFEPGEEPAAETMNWLFNLIYLWIVWLNALVAGSTDRLVKLTAAGNLEASNTFDGELTLGANRSMEVSGTGKYYHGEETIVISASAAETNYPGGGDVGASSNTPGNWNFIQPGTTNATAAYISYPINIPVGRRIKSWSVTVVKTTDSSHTMTADLGRLSMAGDSFTVVGSSQSNSANSPLITTMGESGLTHTILTNNQYVVRVRSVDSSTANGVDQTGALVVVFDYPRP